MINIEKIISLPKNEDEVILVLSALGFTHEDWPFLERLGPSLALTQSLVEQRLKASPKNYPYLEKFFTYMRGSLDVFYEKGGFLLNPRSKNPIFSAKESPLVFFGRGEQRILACRPAIAIVGSRKASEEACLWTRKLAKNLADEDITIISGGALGIDFAAHNGAKGKNSAVILGVPADLYNDERATYIKELGEKGVVYITAFGPWQPSQKYMFVKRNQFVVALADALVVVQGMAGSGTLHTAKYALGLKKPVFAVPGALENPLSEVPNQLLAQGVAKVLLGPQEILNCLNKATSLKQPKEKIPEKNQPPRILPPLLRLLSENNKALSMDELIFFSGLSLIDVQNKMLEYEMEGLVKKRGAQFMLI